MEAKVVLEGLPEFLRALKRYAPEVRKDFNKKARGIVSVIAADAKTRASWSTRIPRAITPTVTTRYVGVRLVKRKAPHGALYERGNTNGSGSVRHPLFGNRNFWYSTPVRPFLAPAVEAKRDVSVAAMLVAIEEAKRGAGLV